MMKTGNNKDAYYIPPPVKRQLKKGMEAIRKADQDRVVIITGPEGSGKSLLMMQLASHIDPNFSLDDICFTADEFAKRIREKEKYGVVAFDEAFNGLSSKGAISKENKRLIRLLQECRQRNLWVFILLPSVFLLEKYVALFRSHLLIHTQIYKRDFTKRYYKVYNRQNKKMLYILGYKYMSYSKPKLHKKYRFYGKYPSNINEVEYRAKKLKSFQEGEKRDSVDDVVMKQRNVVIYKAHKEHKVPYVVIAKWLEDENCPLHPKYLTQLHPKTPKSKVI